MPTPNPSKSSHLTPLNLKEGEKRFYSSTSRAILIVCWNFCDHQNNMVRAWWAKSLSVTKLKDVASWRKWVKNGLYFIGGKCWNTMNISRHISEKSLQKIKLSRLVTLQCLCKVEFIQWFCWLYSVPNLLVIWHLETLYLGGNHVRIVCERVWRKAQECAIKKSLTTRSHDWLGIGKSPKKAHMWSMQGS